MPNTLDPIPLGVSITDRTGTITDFFRLRWEQLRNSFQFTPTVADVSKLAQTAAIVTTAAYTTKTEGFYRVSYYARKTVADGVASSLQFTWGWTDRDGSPLTDSDTALATDTASAQKSNSKIVWAKANTDLTYAVAYLSNTPNKMKFNLDLCCEFMA